MSKVIIVDDSDSAITYQGNWTTGTIIGAIADNGSNSNEHNSTVHISTTPGDKLVYTFEGTSISLFGTLDKPNDFGIPNASFKIDDLPTELFNRSGNVLPDNFGITTSHTRLYQSTTLIQGSHRLTVTVTDPSKAGARFIMDYLTVWVGSNVTSANVIVDDSELTYTGDWTPAGATAEYMGTTHATPTSGGGDVSMSFYGTDVSVYATIGRPFPDFEFSLDGTNVNNFTGPLGTDLGKHARIFHSQGLAPGQNHTLTMTLLSGNRWYLDYIVYKATNPTTNTNVGQQVQSSAPLSNIGAIVGGVIGALALVSLIIFLILRSGRNRKQKHAVDEDTRTHGIPSSHPGVDDHMIQANVSPPIVPYQMDGRTPSSSSRSHSQTVGKPQNQPGPGSPSSFNDGITWKSLVTFH